MAHTLNFFMAILMVVLLFSTGMHKTEARGAECIGPCYVDIGVASCKLACEKRGHQRFVCTSDNKCCCTD
ncbi:hypothetical protein TSUD_02950 [Trifolium subterraneum]|uniref:Knottin scorpion toxin-like domain-containing protein n=1 Tax=Trifolium subterraneum TaxID=3900 RepID=A0A2Z6MNT6_TRISU|nr:hypothetical protein TSUD_02950 [Trifolium subterraneum]